jgi:succinoglycan biosynthesis transport protein ExoP
MLKKIEAPSPDFNGAAVYIYDFYNLILRQYPIVFFVFFLAVGLGGVYVISTPQSFTAQTAMLIDTRKVQLFQQSVLGELSVDSATVESQVQITKSEGIALRVIKELHLTEDPEFSESGGDLFGALVKWVRGWFDFSSVKSERDVLRGVTEAFANRLTVRRVGLTYIIEIAFRSRDRGRSAQIANKIADAYVEDQLDAKYNATRRASVWLQDRIRELREQASTAQRAVVEFKTRNNIVESGGRLMNEQQLGELNSQLVLARAQTTEARARLDRIQQVIRSDVPDATVTDTLRSDVVSKLRSQYLELANREADWSARYGRDHLAAVHLRNQMREIRRSMVEELRRLAESYKSEYEIAKQREDTVQRGLAQVVTQSQETNQAQVALRELESTAQTYRALYDNFLQRYMESVQQQSFPTTEARVITPATPPLRKSHPQTLLILTVIGAGGLMVGLAVAWLREVSERVFRTSTQVQETLQTDCIAVVPMLADRRPPGSSARVKTVADDSRPRTIVRDSGAIWQVVDSPFSRFTEAIRSMKVAVDLSGIGKINKVIGITSSLPNEGKSTLAASLAQLMSHTGARTILVDCDLRNPELTRKLVRRDNCRDNLGIIDLVAGKAALDEVIWTDPSTNLTFLPATTTRFSHTSEILASDATKKLFANLRERYEFVVVDLSPLAPVVDARATTHFLDSYVFVIEWGRTKFDVVARVLADAPGIHKNLLGVVLNKANLGTMGRYEGGGYYSGKYYHRYGYTE